MVNYIERVEFEEVTEDIIGEISELFRNRLSVKYSIS